MKRLSTIGLALFLTIGLVSCGTAQENTSNATVQTGAVIAKNVNTNEFKELIASKKDGILLDVRTAGELTSEGSIEGNINIDVRSVDFKEQLSKLDKDKPVMVYCHSGGRSGRALEVMKEMGFKEVYNLSGGISAWINDGKPVK
ncbi:MAG: rhodanese-like domain-containing protein [Cyclobacteriaceae bacterium]|nr:rhodanese-like domain-containing protein [Cyclobacteriaceae bacterium]